MNLNEDEITKVQLWEKIERFTNARIEVEKEIYVAVKRIEDSIYWKLLDMQAKNKEDMEKKKQQLSSEIKDFQKKTESGIEKNIQEMKDLILEGIKQLDKRMVLFDQSIEARFKNEVQQLRKSNEEQIKELEKQTQKVLQDDLISYQKTLNISINTLSGHLSKRDKEIQDKLNKFPDMVTGLVRSGILDRTKIMDQKIEEILSALTIHQKDTDTNIRELREQLALKMAQINKRLDDTMNRFKFVSSQLG